MDGNYNGYMPYSQQQQHGQQQQSQSQAQPQSQSQPPHSAYSHQQQHQDSPSHTTLPPLQGQNGYSQFGNMSYGHPHSQSHTPTTPHTPATSSIAGNNSNAYMSPNHGPHGMLPPTSFNSPYAMSQSMMYPSSTSTSNPSATSSVGLPTLRPMPTGGVNGSMHGLPSLSAAGQMGQQPSFMQNEEAPTHVVGSQGRRGILPTAPGRPNPPAQGTAANAKSMIPQKDADGKYPCPHCNKTYLHAKHLKRHLLRRE